MTFRILISDAVYDEREDAASAKSLALTEAAILADQTRQPISVRVYRMGSPTRDELGRDTTPAFLIGRAIATSDSVRWAEGSSGTRRLTATPKERAA